MPVPKMQGKTTPEPQHMLISRSRSPSNAHVSSSDVRNTARRSSPARKPSMDRTAIKSSRTIITPSMNTSSPPSLTLTRQMSNRIGQKSSPHIIHDNSCRAEVDLEIQKRLRSSTVNKPQSLKQAVPTHPRSRSCSITRNLKQSQPQTKTPSQTVPHLTKPSLNPATEARVGNKSSNLETDSTRRSRMSMFESKGSANKPKRSVESGKLQDIESNGYGKPLITPINKKLTIKNYILNTPPTRINSKELSPAIRKPRSDPAQGYDQEFDKLPTKDKVFKNKLRLWNSSSQVHTNSKTPAIKNNHNAKPIKPSSTSLNIYTSPNNEIKIGALQHDINKLKEPCIKYPVKCDKSKSILDSENRDKRPSVLDLIQTDKNPLIGNTVTRYNDVRPTLVRNMSPSRPNRTLSATVHSSIKSYKPQLEDIKSSYLLLNKRGGAQIKAGITPGKTRLSTNAIQREAKTPFLKIMKPNPIDESMRQQQLREAKEKFTSKRFFNDSKYDKIEGLNWISWK